MTIEVLATMLFSVNAAVELFKRVLNNYPMPAQFQKTVLFICSILVGIFVAFTTPGALEIFKGTALIDNELAATVLLGFSLGFGSKFTYYMVDLVNVLREVQREKIIKREA